MTKFFLLAALACLQIAANAQAAPVGPGDLGSFDIDVRRRDWVCGSRTFCAATPISVSVGNAIEPGSFEDVFTLTLRSIAIQGPSLFGPHKALSLGISGPLAQNVGSALMIENFIAFWFLNGAPAGEVPLPGHPFAEGLGTHALTVRGVATGTLGEAYAGDLQIHVLAMRTSPIPAPAVLLAVPVLAVAAAARRQAAKRAG